MRRYIATCFAFVALTIPTFARAATYDIDPAHSSFNFKVRHLTVSNVTGDLTLRGVTKEVTVDVEGSTPEIKDPGGKMRRGATGTTKINRKDFGIT